MDDESALETIVNAFGATDRPPRFVDASHCEECADHEAALQAVTPNSMTYATFGTPGWDPVSFLQCDGLAYFMPGLVRLALFRGSNRDYIPQFCGHMRPERMACFTAQQRGVMRRFLEYFRDSREADIRSNLDARRLFESLERCIAGLAD